VLDSSLPQASTRMVRDGDDERQDQFGNQVSESDRVRLGQPDLRDRDEPADAGEQDTGASRPFR